MSIENAREHLRAWGKEADILEFPVSSATVELAAAALGIEAGRIAKSLSFGIGEEAILVIMAGDVKIDNRKYKDQFGLKARLLSPEEVRELIGHEIGGVCPFGIKAGVEVYLDLSLRRFDFVYPACGSGNSAIKLGLEELEKISRAKSWIDVAKAREG